MKQQKSTKKRSFVKGFVWETSMFILCILIFWAFGMDFMKSLGINTFILIIKISLYYVNERIWKKIKWGKI